MKRAGCHYVLFGVESGSQRMLDLMEKNAKLPAVSAGLSAARKVGMNFISNFMIGHPGETAETVRQTVEFCKSHRLLFLPSYVTLFPNSKMFHLVVSKIKDWAKYFDWLSRVDYSRNFFMNLTELADRDLMRLRNWAVSETLAAALCANALLQRPAAWLLRAGLVASDHMPNWARRLLRNFLLYTLPFLDLFKKRAAQGDRSGRQIPPGDLGQELAGPSSEDTYEESLRALQSST